MSALDEIAGTVRSAAGRAGPAVVRIGRDGRGAGVVLAEGQVLTSAHNLRGTSVTVTFPDGRRSSGEVQGVDGDGDLAVVAVTTGGTQPLDWAPEGPALGDVVLAVGPVPGSGQPRVTVGFVSAVGVSFRGPRGRLIADAFEHTAVLGRGSSGGPVLDREGRLAGLNTHRPGEGLYLAVPATAALRSSVDALARGESPSRRRLGIAVAPAHVARRLRAAVGLPPREGLLVREVADDSPAAAGGVARGDLIVSVGGTPVASVEALAAAVDAAPAGQVLPVTVVRGVDELALEVAIP